MGIYYRYANFTLKEYVSLSDLRDGGDKRNAVIHCAPALAWLISDSYNCDDGYHGRWRPQDSAPRAGHWLRAVQSAPPDMRIISDNEYDWYDLDHDQGFLNISPGLLHSMRTQCPGVVEDWKPRVHDVDLSIHHISPSGATLELLDAVSASCKCGWKVGPIYGDNREETLTRIVSNHVSNVKR